MHTASSRGSTDQEALGGAADLFASMRLDGCGGGGGESSEAEMDLMARIMRQNAEKDAEDAAKRRADAMVVSEATLKASSVNTHRAGLEAPDPLVAKWCSEGYSLEGEDRGRRAGKRDGTRPIQRDFGLAGIRVCQEGNRPT